uniref:RRM domain-containing protein n=1 Tax=Mesocestoides corti TaxID=53468 RepID=A0A5K3F2Z9_MESCO
MASRNFVASDVPRYRVFVGNLPKNSLQSYIERIFEGCKISEIQMIRNPETDEFRGFAYVELKDEESYERALSFDGTLVNGKEIRVNNAERRGNQGRGGRGRGGGGGGGGGGPRDFNGRNS